MISERYFDIILIHQKQYISEDIYVLWKEIKMSRIIDIIFSAVLVLLISWKLWSITPFVSILVLIFGGAMIYRET